MSYKRKTKEVYTLLARYDNIWQVVVTEETYIKILDQLHVYRQKYPDVQYKLECKRVKINQKEDKSNV